MVIYEEYIKSKEWEEKSISFIKSVGYCEDCGRDKCLGCHHITYNNLGNETKEDIKILCWWCHKYKHNNTNWKPKNGVNKYSEFLKAKMGKEELQKRRLGVLELFN